MDVEGTTRYPIAVLVSGSGTNLQALIDASIADDYSCEIVAVISDRGGVHALERAAIAQIPSVVVSWSDYCDRETFTEAVCDIAERHGAAALVLAGFMRILSPEAIRRFPLRIINTHPALLPAFPGAHGISEALSHGVKLSGVTIHFVDEEVDHGPIIYQESVLVEAEDDDEQLRAKIQAIEHREFPRVIDAFGRGLLSVEGRLVNWERR